MHPMVNVFHKISNNKLEKYAFEKNFYHFYFRIFIGCLQCSVSELVSRSVLASVAGERDPFTAVFREKFRSQGTWRRVTGTNLDKTLDTQQTDKIRHRINFVSESVWPMRGSDIDLMTNKRMGRSLSQLLFT